ncbi:hypothetical protein R3P38DRAFT_3200995 [Favolaschia claudopus]|uniref:Uncharacterized protein n=1 Tax=Favolaschia claudopus TaxID=2862362 RepID=A0AAW0AYN1_9AGAR
MSLKQLPLAHNVVRCVDNPPLASLPPPDFAHFCRRYDPIHVSFVAGDWITFLAVEYSSVVTLYIIVSPSHPHRLPQQCISSVNLPSSFIPHTSLRPSTFTSTFSTDIAHAHMTMRHNFLIIPVLDSSSSISSSSTLSISRTVLILRNAVHLITQAWRGSIFICASVYLVGDAPHLAPVHSVDCAPHLAPVHLVDCAPLWRDAVPLLTLA